MLAIYFAARDPRTPWYAKALALCVAGYALSPIDLIPDFVPVLGYLDDLVIVPLGILAVLRLIPPEIMAENRAAAALCAELSGRHVSPQRIELLRTERITPWRHLIPAAGDRAQESIALLRRKFPQVEGALRSLHARTMTGRAIDRK